MSACGCDGNNLRPVDQAIAELQALRKKLIDHIGWFENKQRKSK